MACRNCNEMGHFARDCPAPKKPIESVCYNCGEVCGYLARDCPKPPSAEAIARRQNQVCYNCGEACGNLAKDCTRPPAADRGGFRGGRGGGRGFSRGGGRGRGGRGGSGGPCYNCQQFGHMAKDCPHPASGQRPERTCYKCQKPGHLARDCPEADVQAPVESQ